MSSLRETLSEAVVANVVGLLVGTLLGGGVMFFVQREINANDAAKKDVVLEAIPKLEKFKRAIVLHEWETMMDLDPKDRAARLQRMVTATEARWDSLADASDLIDLKLRLSFDSATAADFHQLLVELGFYRDRAVLADLGLVERLSRPKAYEDSAALDEYLPLKEGSDSLQIRITNFENRLLKAIN
jgi:hypothetical protein